MTPQPPRPQGPPDGPEHEPRPEGEGPEVSADDQRWMDELNAGRDHDAAEERAPGALAEDIPPEERQPE
ncbi:MAG: hypothetical protein WD898_01480, partial [Candidatus Paceibacterota bacterium]